MKVAKTLSYIATLLALAVVLTSATPANADFGGDSRSGTVYKETVIWSNPQTGQQVGATYTWTVWKYDDGRIERSDSWNQARTHVQLMKAQGYVRTWTSGVVVVDRIEQT